MNKRYLLFLIILGSLCTRLHAEDKLLGLCDKACISATKHPPTLVLKQPVKLAEAIPFAFAQRLTGQCYRIAQKQWEEKVALSGYLPQLTINSRIGRSYNNLLAKDLFSFEVRQLLYSFSGPIEEYHIAQQNTAIERRKKELLKDQFRFEIEKNFLNLRISLNKKQSVKALDYSSRSVFSQGQDREKVGFFGQPDWFGEIARYQESQSDVSRYADEFAKAVYEAQRATEIYPIESIDDCALRAFIDESLTQDEGVALDFYLKQAAQNRKELSIKNEEIERERQLAQLYAHRYLPSISFLTQIDDKTFKRNSSTSSTNSTAAVSTLAGTISYTWFVGLELNWSFDGLGNASRSGASQASMAATISDKFFAQLDINLEVQKAYHNLQELKKQLVAAHARLEQAEKTFAFQKTAYEIGQISPVDFAGAQTTWEQAQFTLQDVEIQTTVAYRELLFKCGYPEYGTKYENEKL